MSKFLHIGFDAYVNVGKIRVITQCDAEKLRRELKKRGIDKTSPSFWDATCGKEIKSILVLDDFDIVASPLSAETLIKRCSEMIMGGKSND